MRTIAIGAGIRKAAGYGLIAAGLAAIPIPVMSGIPLIAAGAGLLGGDHPLVRGGKDWLRKRGIRMAGRNQNELSNMQS